MQMEKFPKAYEAYQQAVYRDGRNPTFWCSIGVLYYQINQYRDALDAYSRAIRLNPYISEVWYDLGTLVRLPTHVPVSRVILLLTLNLYSTRRATTRSPMPWMPISGPLIWILQIPTSRLACSSSAVARPMAPHRAKHRCPPMSILKRTRLLAPSGPRDRNGPARVPAPLRSSRRHPC